jgi:hypothetical protein
MAGRLACRGDAIEADDVYASGTLVKGEIQ